MSTIDDAIGAAKAILADWSAQLPQSHSCNAHDWGRKAQAALQDTILPAIESTSKQDKTAEVLKVAHAIRYGYGEAANELSQANDQLNILLKALAEMGFVLDPPYTGYSPAMHVAQAVEYDKELRALEEERA